MRRIVMLIAAVLLIATGALAGCVSRQLPRVSAELSAAPAFPALTGSISPADRDRLKSLFESEIYGAMPEPAPARRIEAQSLTTTELSAGWTAERWRLEIADGVELNAAVFAPSGPGPHPVIIMQTFCNLRVVSAPAAQWSGPAPGACGEGGGLMNWLALQIFGEHIAQPPYQAVIERGYALAIIHPGEIAPDSADRAGPALDQLEAALGFSSDWGVIGAWAWLFSSVSSALDADPRFDSDRVAVWGHSRNGKSALLAAAFDDRIDAVLSLQSGTGGATLTRSHNGESVAQITESYPHWFAPKYASWAGREDALEIDQHQLLALIAPRPVLLGNARRDQWSDPHGTWRAAEGADPVYEAMGAAGLDQADFITPNLEAELSVYTRDGLHGVHGEDWERALDFLDAHWRAERG